MDVPEVLRQRLRRLSVAGAAIPGQIARRTVLRKPGEQLGRVAGSGLGVVGGVAREMIGGRNAQIRSMIMAMPWPTPMHMVHSA